jgi:ABC-type dipeptide/oligopeptide/nickel transport system ATPase subunit
MIETDKLFAGDIRTIARAITKIENGTKGAAELMKAVFPKTGRATVIGVTGAPGAGKSSLVDKLALYYKNKGRQISALLQEQRRADRHHLHRSIQPVLGRCDPRRPHPDGDARA